MNDVYRPDTRRAMRKTMRNHMWRNRCLPYGLWTCEDGREVMFNRFYQPIFQRYEGEAPVVADSGEWVKTIRKQNWFYHDGTSFNDSIKAACVALGSWGVEIPEIPTIPRKRRERWL